MISPNHARWRNVRFLRGLESRSSSGRKSCGTTAARPMVFAGQGRRLLLSCIVAAATVLRQLPVPAELLLFPVTPVTAKAVAAAVATAAGPPLSAQRHDVLVHLSLLVGVAVRAPSARPRTDVGLVQPQHPLASSTGPLDEVAVVVVLHLASGATLAASAATRCAGNPGVAIAELMQVLHVFRAIAWTKLVAPLAQSPGPLHATALVMATLLAVARATLPARARRVFRCVVLLQSDGVTHMSMNNTCVIALRVCVCVCVFDSAHAKRG